MRYLETDFISNLRLSIMDFKSRDAPIPIPTNSNSNSNSWLGIGWNWNWSKLVVVELRILNI